MKIGILSPDNPHKGLHRDAELLAWALTSEVEGGNLIPKEDVDIFHVKNLLFDSLSTESSDSSEPTPWSIGGGTALDSWLMNIDVLFISEQLNSYLFENILPSIKIVYIPNLEWARLAGVDGDVATWISSVRSFIPRGLIVLAKSPTIGAVLVQHNIECTVVDWSIPDEIRTELRSNRRKKKRVLMNAGLGGWRSRRGVDVMIEAINSIPSNMPIKFIIKTIKPWEKYELGEIPDGVELVEGFLSRNEMNELVESADLIIYPSRFEGFGLSLLEALHKGIPVMCTNGWPMNELQTIQDPRLLIEVSKTVPLRLAWSFEPKAESIVANLVAIKKKKLSKLFPVSEVTRGLKERQDTFRIQIQSIVNNLMKMA